MKRDGQSRTTAASLAIYGRVVDSLLGVQIVELLAEAGVRQVFSSAGDPALFTGRLHDAGMTVVHVVGSLKAAQKAADDGVDALVVEGDIEASVANTGQVSSRIVDLLPVSEIVKRTWAEIEDALDAARARMG